MTTFLGQMFATAAPSIFDERHWQTSPFLDSRSGETISPTRAFQLPAYYSCIRVVSEDIAKSPCRLYEISSDGNSRSEAVDHPAYELVNLRPNRLMTAFDFWETIFQHANGWGNGYAKIIRRGSRPVGFDLIHPSRVTVRLIDGELIYKVKIKKNDAGPAEEEMLSAEDVIHIHGMGSEGYDGYSVLLLNVDSVGLGLAGQGFASSFYKNGASSRVVLEHPGNLSPEAAERLRKGYESTYGGADNAGRAMVLEEGMGVKAITIPPNDAQLLESRSFQVEEICRWFRVPPVKIGHNQNTPYTNVESLNQAYVGDALQPWVERAEQELKLKLLTKAERKRYRFDFDLTNLLRGDHQARGNFYKTMREIGALSVNEVRHKEGANPIPDGDDYHVQMNLTTLERISNGENLSKSAESEPEMDEEAEEAEENEENEENTPETAPNMDESAARALIKPFVLDAVTWLHAKESKALNRYIGHSEQDSKLESFYKGFKSDIIKALSTSLLVFRDLTGNNCAENVVQYANSYQPNTRERSAEDLTADIMGCFHVE